MTWIYLSPHLDDAVYSCGGLIWEQTRRGERVEIWTITAGDPPPGPASPLAQALHERWHMAIETTAARRAEDEVACRRVGAVYRHFDLADCIYRWLPDGRALVDENRQLFTPIHPAEYPLIDEISRRLADGLPRYARLVSPLTVGGHMDHRLTRAAAERLGRSLWYYADYPYVASQPDELPSVAGDLERRCTLDISAAGLRAWQAAVADYVSQASSFWPDRETLDAALEKYCREDAGACLWRRKPATSRKA